MIRRRPVVSLWRAVGIGVVLFFASLLVNAVCARALGLNLEAADPADLPTAMWAMALGSVIVLSILGSVWYFRSPKSAAGAASGLLVGLVADTVGFLLDGVAIIPLVGGWAMMAKYYHQPFFWLAFGLIPVTCAVAGHVLEQRPAVKVGEEERVR